MGLHNFPLNYEALLYVVMKWDVLLKEDVATVSSWSIFLPTVVSPISSEAYFS